MPSIGEKNETEEDEEMEQDTPESDKSEDEDDSDTGSGSEDDESSEMDEEECSRRRTECLYDMAELERQFTEVREQYVTLLEINRLYRERSTQIECKLDEVRSGRAPEYLNRMAQLQENMRIRTQVAGILKELKLQNIRNKYEAEEQAGHQHYQSELLLLNDNVRQDLEEKIRRLEEDRQNIDITSDLWESQTTERRMKKKGPQQGDLWSPERRRKPVTVTGPYIIYMLKDMEIIEDWTAIKKALKQSQRRKEMFKVEKHPYHARYDDGKLFYEGELYTKGHHIIIDNREDSPVHATVTAINTGEVWVKRSDGNKSKLYIAQLQKGKYTIRHVPY